MGYNSFPVIIIGDKVLTSFSPPMMDAALRAAGHM